MFDSSKLMYSSGSGNFYSFPIEQSLRIDGATNPLLSHTPSSVESNAGTTHTASVWVKLGNHSAGVNNGYANVDYSSIFGIGNNNNYNYMIGYYGAAEQFDFNYAGHYSFRTPAAKHRDPSAWYHIVAAFDTTQATSTDRVKIWINGEQITNFATATYPTQNDTLFFQSTTNPRGLGSMANLPTSGYYPFDGYLSEFHFVDGQQLDATDFGEFKSGVWIPKEYTGSHGASGYYMDFSGTYYEDKSGNGNDFAAYNLAATDVVLDTPTNNFATLNPIDASSSFTLSEGSLKTYQTAQGVVKSTFGMTSSKWYAEALYVGGSNHHCGVIVGGKTETAYLGGQAHGYSYYRSGLKYNSASGSSYGASYTTGDIVGIAFDADNGTLTYYKNGVSQGTAFTGLTGNTYHFATGMASAGDISLFNFGQDSSFAGNKTAQGNTDDNGYGDFYYAPPTGYLALCTANLTVPDAMNPALDNSPQDYFNTVLWSGDNTYPRTITGVGFQPDLVWTKTRNYAYDHIVYDSVRGTGTSKSLTTNSTGVEGANAAYANLSGFDVDGFEVDTTSGTNVLNVSGRNFVAWNWKANGSGVSNTDGSITSTVSANTDAGFSIVSYAGTADTTATIGHGLLQAPELIITKNRDYTDGWIVGSDYLSSWDYYLALHATDAQGYATNIYVDAPSSTTYNVGNDRGLNSSGYNYISYCFHSVEGFSKIGLYFGNGSTDGTFVYTGFKPAFVMVKRYNAAEDWALWDNKRDPYNKAERILRPNSAAAESTSFFMDLNSNGFKIRNTDPKDNTSGNYYIYMAFAETPFKYANAR